MDTNAVIEPGAVMVEAFDTFVALSTVLRFVVYNSVTDVAKEFVFIIILKHFVLLF